MKERKNSSDRWRWSSVVLFTILFFIVFSLGAYWGYQSKHRLAINRALRFMTPHSELSVDKLPADPFDDRDYAWDSEVPSFITSDFTTASFIGYDGVEYTFGENKISVRKGFLGDELELMVNSDFGWSMNDFSIYSYGENVVVYGYWNDEFRRITLGKTEDSIIKDVLTLNPDVPFSANGKYISEGVKKDCIFVISKDMSTVSAYRDHSQIGEAVVLPDEILGFYDKNMILTNFDADTDKLYVPYIIDNNGREELICLEVATVSVEEVNNVSSAEYLDDFQSYTTYYSATIGYGCCCYIFETSDGRINMIVPNNIKKYSAYLDGTATLSVDDDLGWHWVTLYD